jgi:hypothetical protein
MGERRRACDSPDANIVRVSDGFADQVHWRLQE